MTCQEYLTLKSHVRGKEHEKSLTDIHVMLCYSDNPTIIFFRRNRTSFVTEDKTGLRSIPYVLETENYKLQFWAQNEIARQIDL